MPGHGCIDDFSRNFRHHKHFSVRKYTENKTKTEESKMWRWRPSTKHYCAASFLRD